MRFNYFIAGSCATLTPLAMLHGQTGLGLFLLFGAALNLVSGYFQFKDLNAKPKDEAKS